MNAGTALRLGLHDRGYTPLPIQSPSPDHPARGKACVLQGWSSVGVTPETICDWEHGRPAERNTGIRLGATRDGSFTVALDVDVMCPTLCNTILRLADEMLPELMLWREGLAPKSLGLYRTMAAFAVLRSPLFVLPNGLEAKVEILGQGQQFVAFGMHPSGKPYEWIRGVSPDQVNVADVPVASEQAFRAFLAAAIVAIREAGGVEKPGQAESVKPAKVADSTDNNFFRRVNAAALLDIGSWYRTIFPTAAMEDGTRAWRVTSEDIGRALEEDISMHPEYGGKDFGLNKPCSPLDVVVDYGPVSSVRDAALWLCKQLGITPETLGWVQPPLPFVPPTMAASTWPQPVDLFGSLSLPPSSAARAPCSESHFRVCRRYGGTDGC